ncbi:hypothetical protein [Streptomyces erythrochromogenes]|uniref:hypothetical protein n=1 Tax=Streptomyces erythrochromogenes TaxID=285574 RepID=UPI00368E85BA
MLTLLDSLGESVAAIVLGRRGDVLARHRTGHALLAEHVSHDLPQDLQRRSPPPSEP